MFWRQVNNAARLLVRRSPLAEPLRRYLRKTPLTGVIRLGRREGWERAAQWLLSAQGLEAINDSAVERRLRRGINTDIETEFLLTEVRRQLLLGPRERLDDPGIQTLVCTLVRQCLNNEYVWYVSDAEREQVNALRERIDTALAGGDRLDWRELALVSLYVRFDRILGGGRVADRIVELTDKPPRCFDEFFGEWLAGYRQELALRESIPCFGTIDDPVSAMIARTYEEYPYPRWVELKLHEPGTRERLLRRFFDAADLAFLDRPFDVLVAGCGTGSKAIQYALDYGERANILAIDLSRASLAYAARMAERYGAGNIEFLQMDMFDLPKLDRTFDIIECTGVLHHFKDPVEGGRALVGAARDGGIVHISLYSESARREIVRLRRGYEDRLDELTDDDVRAYRRRWMHGDPDLIDERLPLRWDFFDLNRCKDLLFHPLEHRFTVPQIEQYLQTLGLEFRGIERPGLDHHRFWTRYPPEHKQGELASWHEFEKRHPDAFANLYELWTKKRPT